MGFMAEVERARQFAEAAHSKQVRKYTSEPYIVHPVAVATRLVDVSEDATIEAIQAAFLHDVVEDTDISLETIRSMFGKVVAEYVWYLTKAPEYIGNRGIRKMHDRMRLGIAPNIVKLIKIIDVLDNAKSIKAFDLEFWSKFKEETMLLFEAMDSESVIAASVSDRTLINEYDSFMKELYEV